MQNPFSVLDIDCHANAQAVRAAYHVKVKQCHPDGLQGDVAQKAAQERLVRLNLAYEEAMRQVTLRDAGGPQAILPDAMQVARKLNEQGHVDAALRILNRAPLRDGDWYYLQGNLLLRKHEAQAAHESFRAAVRTDPQNHEYRNAALTAAVAMRKQQTLHGRMACWA
ncbi:MAG: J domain-containing protein, partial [Clostridia bacterium]